MGQTPHEHYLVHEISGQAFVNIILFTKFRNFMNCKACVDETNQATAPTDGDKYLKDVMKPVPEGAGFFTDKTPTAGVYDPNIRKCSVTVLLIVVAIKST